MSWSRVSFLLRPTWLAFHALVFGGIALMIWLGLWQLDRLDQRREFNDRVAARIEQPPVPLAELLAEAGSDPDAIEWRQVTVSGTWVPEQVLWFNRSQDGVAGDNVLTAMQVAPDPSANGTDPAGSTVLVNRGFVPLAVDTPAAPTGEVDILARVRETQDRQRGELTDAASGGEPLLEVRRIDLGELAPQFPGQLLPFYLDLIDTAPPLAATDPVPVPAPTLDEGPHLSYAIQWFIFATCVLIGWVLAVRRSLRTRRNAGSAVDDGRREEPGGELGDGLTAAGDGRTAPGSAPRGDAVRASSMTGTDES